MLAGSTLSLFLAACGGGNGEAPEQPLALDIQPVAAQIASIAGPTDAVDTDAAVAAQALGPEEVVFGRPSEQLTTTASVVADSPNQPASGVDSTAASTAPEPGPTMAATAAQRTPKPVPISTGFFLANRTASENWANARLLAANDRVWASWLGSRRDLLGKWFGQARDRVDLIAGYPNDLVDAQTGAAVPWTYDMAEPPAGTTAAEVKYKSAWVAINRQYNISRTLDAARFYKLSGDLTLAETAARQLDFYANNYANWPLRTAIGNARMLGQSLDEAVSALEMLQAANALTAYATPQRQALWRDGLFKPMAVNLQTYAYGALNNINLWCSTAVAAIGMQYKDATLLAAGTTGPKGVNAVLATGVTRDGIWFEGSFAYNDYVLFALARLFDLAAQNGRADLVQSYVNQVQSMLLAPTLFKFDDGTLPMVSDTRSPVAPVDIGTHLALYRHVPTTFGMQAATTTRTWDTLLDAPTAGVKTTALPTAQSRHAEDTRMALLRQGDWQLFVHYGQKTINHAQEEALSYDLAQGTTSISRDAGTATSYSSAQHADYFSKGVGNNVPLIDGQGQEQWAPGVVQTFDATAGVLDVSHPTYRHDVSVSRRFQLGSAGLTELTRLNLVPPQTAARRLGVMFNTACGVAITDPRAGLGTSAAAPSGSPGFALWSQVQRYNVQATWSAVLTCAGKPYALTVSTAAPHTAYSATAPNTPLPATRNALYVEASGTDVSFQTHIRALP